MQNFNAKVFTLILDQNMKLTQELKKKKQKVKREIETETETEREIETETETETERQRHIRRPSLWRFSDANTHTLGEHAHTCESGTLYARALLNIKKTSSWNWSSRSYCPPSTRSWIMDRAMGVSMTS